MEDKKKEQEQSQQSGEQNPTLDSPGSQVADYGNPTGGSAVEGSQQNPSRSGNAQDEKGRSSANEETIGNP